MPNKKTRLFGNSPFERRKNTILDSSPRLRHRVHEVDFGETNSLQIKSKIKAQSTTCDSQPHKILISVLESSQDILNQCCAKLPQKDNLRRGIRRQQASAHPRPPNSLDDVGELRDKYTFF